MFWNVCSNRMFRFMSLLSHILILWLWNGLCWIGIILQDCGFWWGNLCIVNVYLGWLVVRNRNFISCPRLHHCSKAVQRMESLIMSCLWLISSWFKLKNGSKVLSYSPFGDLYNLISEIQEWLPRAIWFLSCNEFQYIISPPLYSRISLHLVINYLTEILITESNRLNKTNRTNSHSSTIEKEVRNFVRDCQVCQRFKPENVASPELLQLLPISQAIWKDLSMDFIGVFVDPMANPSFLL